MPASGENSKPRAKGFWRTRAEGLAGIHADEARARAEEARAKVARAKKFHACIEETRAKKARVGNSRADSPAPISGNSDLIAKLTILLAQGDIDKAAYDAAVASLR